MPPLFAEAAIAQLGERQTEDLKVPGSVPGLGNLVRVVVKLWADAFVCQLCGCAVHTM